VTTPVFGPDPEGFTLHLPLDEDFVGVIDIPDDEQALNPAGSVRLYFIDTTPPTTWEGVLVETDPGECRQVIFEIDELQVDAVRALKPKNVRLQYVLGESKLVWDRGRVRYV